MRRALAVTILLVSSAHASGPAPVPASGWQELRSEHFVLLTDSSTETATALIKRLERGRLLMLMVMWSGRTTPAGRMRVIHFAHQRDLVDLTRSGISGLVESDAFGGRIVATAESWDGIDMVLNHELAHRLSEHFIPRQPRWIAEGITTYLETIRTDLPLVDGRRAAVELEEVRAALLAASWRRRFSSGTTVPSGTSW